MSTVIFEQTERSRYASQGEEPSGLPGYNIWLKMDDNSYTFLGFTTTEDAPGWAQYYRDLGDTVLTAVEKKP